MPIQRTCVICNSTFSVPPTRAAAKTCSRSCKGKLMRQGYVATWLTKTCAQCGNEFKHPPYQRHRVFCSEPCKRTSESAAWLLAGKSAGGGARRRDDGYIEVYLPQHPLGRYVMQHRIVMEEWLRETNGAPQFLTEIEGKSYLKPTIQVHHKDSDRANNARSNLIACTTRAHRAMHAGRPVPEGEAWPLDGLLVVYVRRHPQGPPT